MATKEDENFWGAFEKFNALFQNRWKPTSAKKKHNDMFGVLIKEGETYFQMATGSGWHQIDKVSFNSMETILYLFINQNPMLKKIGEQILKEKMKNITNTIGTHFKNTYGDKQ